MFVHYSLHYLFNLIERIYFACLGTRKKVLHSYLQLTIVPRLPPYLPMLFLRCWCKFFFTESTGDCTQHPQQSIQRHKLSHIFSHFNFLQLSFSTQKHPTSSFSFLLCTFLRSHSYRPFDLIEKNFRIHRK